MRPLILQGIFLNEGVLGSLGLSPERGRLRFLGTGLSTSMDTARAKTGTTASEDLPHRVRKLRVLGDTVDDINPALVIVRHMP